MKYNTGGSEVCGHKCCKWLISWLWQTGPYSRYGPIRSCRPLPEDQNIPNVEVGWYSQPRAPASQPPFSHIAVFPATHYCISFCHSNIQSAEILELRDKLWIIGQSASEMFVRLFVCLVFNGIFSTYRLYLAIGVWNIYCVGPGEHIAT